MTHSPSSRNFRTLAWLTLALACVSSSLFAAGLSELHRARPAISDDYRDAYQDHALWLPGIGTALVFTPDTTFREYSDGTAILTGEVVDRADDGKRFEILLAFRLLTTEPPAGSPHLALLPGAYADHGGPIDPATWRYYREARGTLHGRGDYAGAVVELRERGPAFQVGVGANNANARFGGSGWVSYEVTAQPDAGISLPEEPNPWGNIGDLNFDLDIVRCVDPAERDPEYGLSGSSHAITLRGIGRDFVFEQVPGLLVENADGTAVLSGIIRRASRPSEAFEVDFRFRGHHTMAPAGSPKLELDPGAYLENGGPVDPETWHYYTELEGTLTGLDDFAGARVDVVPTGPAFQVGFGANGKNVRFGASGWLLWEAISQPHQGSWPATGDGDTNIDLGVCVTTCARAAAADLDHGAGNGGDYAFHLFGLGLFVFTEPGTLVEYEDRAVMRGTVYRPRWPGKMFEVELRLGDRDDAPVEGAAAGSRPRYAYRSFEGTLSGRGLYEGAVVTIAPRGPGFELGEGVHGVNDLFGGYGKLSFAVEDQPDLETLPQSGDGNGRFDFVCARDLQAILKQK